jgi:hypothetical protein
MTTLSLEAQKAYFKQVDYEPHAKQWLYHNSQARYTAAICGRRFGKSLMAGRKIGSQLLIPKQRLWIVGPTYDLGEKEFRVVWDDLIIKLGLGKDKRVKRAFNKGQGDMYIELPNQSRLEVRSADNPEHLVGEALDAAVMSEAAKHKQDTWERFIRPSLSDRRGWATFPSTPEGQNWLYEVWKFGQDPDPTLIDYESWRFPSWENTALYGDLGYDHPEIQQLKRTMPKDAFMQEIAADFTTFVGKIYPEFDELVHVIDGYVYNRHWKNYLFFDFGYINPFCALDVQIDPWDNVFVWREHYKSYEQLDTHINIMKNRWQPDDYRIEMGFGDAADPMANDYIAQHYVQCVSNPDAKHNWRDGIDLVKTFLEIREKEQLVVDEAGNVISESVRGPRLFISRDCPNLIREFNNYKAPNPGTGRNRRSPRETAQSIDDHALDALRYGLMHLYKLGANYHLSDVAVQDRMSFRQSVQLEGSIRSAMRYDVPVNDQSIDAGIFNMGMEF